MLSWLGRLDGNEEMIQKMKEKKKARDKAANIAAEEKERVERLKKERNIGARSRGTHPRDPCRRRRWR